MFTYYLRDSLETRKAKRRTKEKETKKSGGDNVYPGWDALKKEEREESPRIVFTIKNEAGQVVNRVTGSTSSGLHRIAWDLRYAGFVGRGGGSGPLVTPGTYTVSVTTRVDDVETALGEPHAFDVVAIGQSSLPRQDRQQTLEFQMQVGKLQRKVVGTTRKLEDVLSQINDIKKMVRNTPTLDQRLYEKARQLELQLLDVQEQLVGDRTRSQRSQMARVSIMSRVQSALSGTLRQTYGPTKTHRRQYEIGRDQFAATDKELKMLLDSTYQPLLEKLANAGAPWTPGRSLP